MPLRENQLKAKLKRGEVIIGTLMKSRGPYEMVGGFDPLRRIWCGLLQIWTLDVITQSFHSVVAND